MILPYNNKSPRISANCFLAPDCVINGDVTIGQESSVWFGAVNGTGSLVAAGAVVKSGAVIPPNSIVAGNPAVFKRRISDDEKEYFIEWAKNYREFSKGYAEATA
jgi:carbonic anhydrase/acetyltransferase-like protein (isoleucine patch superfamily)